MKSMSERRRAEGMRRLGAPLRRCEHCGTLVLDLVSVFKWLPKTEPPRGTVDWYASPRERGEPRGMKRVDVCETCAPRVEAENQRLIEEETQNWWHQRKIREDLLRTQRASSREYREACAKMEREMRADGSWRF